MAGILVRRQWMKHVRLSPSSLLSQAGFGEGKKDEKKSPPPSTPQGLPNSPVPGLPFTPRARMRHGVECGLWPSNLGRAFSAGFSSRAGAEERGLGLGDPANLEGGLGLGLGLGSPGNVQRGLGDLGLELVSDGTAQGVSEVAAVVGDCFFPIAWLQLLVESVHLHSGLPWWASIAATTVAMRTLMIPVTLYQMRMTARLTMMRPQTEKIMEEMKSSGYDIEVMNRCRAEVKELYRKNKASPLSPMVGVLVQAPLFAFFFFGIRNMVERVASFKEGGALWFIDLSTPDELYILPILTSLTFLLTVELGMAEGMEGNPHAGKMKMGFRVFSLVLIPMTMTFQKALFCYWLTSNLFSLCQGAVLRMPGVKAAAGIPDTSHLSETVTKPALTFGKPAPIQARAVDGTPTKKGNINIDGTSFARRRKTLKKRSGKAS